MYDIRHDNRYLTLFDNINVLYIKDKMGLEFYEHYIMNKHYEKNVD